MIEKPGRKKATAMKQTGTFASWKVPFDYPVHSGGMEGRVAQLVDKGWQVDRKDGSGTYLKMPQEQRDAQMKSRRDNFEAMLAPQGKEKVIVKVPVKAEEIGEREDFEDGESPEAEFMDTDG